MDPQDDSTEAPAPEAATTKAPPPTPQNSEGKEVRSARAHSVLSSQMQKTKLCDFHKEGRCKYGTACAFAHEESELRSMPDLRMTRLCRAFTQGNCNDVNCKFAHGSDELRATDLCYKTELCTWFEKGNCMSGNQCRFAHGSEELRAESEDNAQLKEGQDKPQGSRKKLRKRLKRNFAREKKVDAGASSGSEEPGKKRQKLSTSSVCYRCGSTIATSLGITICPICRM